LSPTVAPERLRVYRSGSRRRWSLLIGHSSLLVANVFPRGRASGPAGLAPEALQERECSCRGFSRGILSVGVVHVSTSIGDVSAGFGDARATDTIRVRCIPRGVAVRRAPEPGPIRGDRGELFVFVLNAPSPSSAGRRVRSSQPHRLGRGLQIPRRVVSGWFKWTPMPRSIRVGFVVRIPVH
jgi:hypothetical protein